MRAFIFSLDAFVAFTLALVAIYSLIFFSSIPSSYYYLLTQAHFLARDTLYSAATSECLTGYMYCQDDMNGASLLNNIAFGLDDKTTMTLVNKTIGAAIPNQFGFSLETSADGISWSTIYDTSTKNLKEKGDMHAIEKKKLSVASQIPVFEYSKKPEKSVNPYYYKTCNEAGKGTDFVITCVDNFNSIVGTENIVPQTKVTLVRITIFI